LTPNGREAPPFQLDVMVPYYGDPELLLAAVASAQALEDVEWRLTVLEDVHPDGPGTERRVRSLGDPRIRYLRNETNLGVSANMFRGIELAEYEHFVILDFDDILLPNYGSVVRDLFAGHPDAAVVQPGIEIIDERGRPYRPLPDRVKAYSGPVNRDVEIRGEAAAISLLRSNWTYGPSLCYRSSFAKKLHLRPNTDYISDLGRIVDMIMDGGSFVVGSEIAFQYRRHRTSHSSTGARDGTRFRQERLYYDTIRAELARMGWHRASRAARVRLFSRLNAAAQLVGAARMRDAALARQLMTHIVL
jgi:hypothetical protein